MYTYRQGRHNNQLLQTFMSESIEGGEEEAAEGEGQEGERE